MKYAHRNNAWRHIARTRAWTEQGGRCAYCRTPLKRADVTADHILPRSKGGTDTQNIAAACAFCNLAKGSIPPKQFKRMINGGLPCPNPYVETVRVMRGISRRTDAACKRILSSVGRTS